MEDGSVHQMSNMDWMLRRSQSLPSKTVSRCHERVQLWLGDKYPTGAHYTGGGGGGGKGHQTPWPGSRGPFNRFRKLHEISMGSPSRTRWKIKRPGWGKFRASSRLVTPTEFTKKGNDEKPESGVYIWPAANRKSGALGRCGQRGIGKFSDRKKMDKTVLFLFCFVLPQGISFVASHSSPVPLRFGWRLLPLLLVRASEPELLDVSEGFPKLIVLVGVESGWKIGKGD